MICREAMENIRDWGELAVRGGGDKKFCPEAFEHIRQCQGTDCFQLWRNFSTVLKDLEILLELPLDDNEKEDAELAFAY